MNDSKNKFVFVKQKFTNKTDVWYNSILIGEICSVIGEETDVDSTTRAADASLLGNTSNRWLTSWKAHTSSNITNIGTYTDRSTAAQAILNEHYKKFKRLENNNEK